MALTEPPFDETWARQVVRIAVDRGIDDPRGPTAWLRASAAERGCVRRDRRAHRHRPGVDDPLVRLSSAQGDSFGHSSPRA
jgi:hypothetical protein